MKTRLFLLSMITMFCVSSAFAQRRYKQNNHRNKNHSLLTYVFNNSAYHGSYERGYQRTNYDRYDRFYDRMSRYDRKRLRSLINKLEERKRCAWEDGYVTDREDRRIYEVEEDIERLLYKYRRNDRNNDSADRYRGSRCR